MLRVTREEFESLKRAGLIKFGKHESNFVRTCKKKPAQRGCYWVEETRRIKNFLGK